jgi:DNA-binding NarL/FixJ family response regulator
MGCQLLKSALMRSRSRFNVVGCTVSRAASIRAVSSHPCDVALISDSLEDGPLTGFRLVRELRTSFPKTRIIMLLKSARNDLVIDAFRAGASGVLCKTEPAKVLTKCVTVVHQGQVWANGAQLDSVLNAFVEAAPLRVDQQKPKLLTRREEGVVALIAEGLSNREVGQKLGLTEHTVGNYLFRIYDKIGISSRVELVLHWLKTR